MTQDLNHESNLDPKDWDALRKLGHQMMDDGFYQLEEIRDNPVW